MIEFLVETFRNVTFKDLVEAVINVFPWICVGFCVRLLIDKIFK